MPPIDDVSVGHSFGLELDGVEISGIAEVSGLKMEQDVIELKENGPDGRIVVRTLPGRWKSSEVTLTRGLTADSGFHSWVKDAQDGTPEAGRSGTITVHDQAGALVQTYAVTHAWPKSLEVLPLVAGAQVLAERIVLVCDLRPG